MSDDAEINLGLPNRCTSGTDNPSSVVVRRLIVAGGWSFETGNGVLAGACFDPAAKCSVSARELRDGV